MIRRLGDPSAEPEDDGWEGGVIDAVGSLSQLSSQRGRKKRNPIGFYVHTTKRKPPTKGRR